MTSVQILQQALLQRLELAVKNNSLSIDGDGNPMLDGTLVKNILLEAHASIGSYRDQVCDDLGACIKCTF
jgi:hypothetical protein